MAKLYNMAQYSEEWWAVRRGLPTASEIKKIVTPERLTASTSRKSYMRRLLCEWALRETLTTDYETDLMKLAKQNEPNAAAGFSLIMDRDLRTMGFVTNDEGTVGCSPDRLFEDKTLEIKCPDRHTHLAYMIDPESLVEEYKLQIQMQIMVGEFEEGWATSWSYDPKFTQVIKRVPRDQKIIAALSTKLASFVDEMLEKRLHITREFGLPAVQDEKAVAAAKHEEEWGTEYHASDEDVEAILSATFPEGMR